MRTNPVALDAQLSPEEMLLAAMLRQALADTGPRAKLCDLAASRVFFSNADGGLAAFCGALGLDVGDVQQMVARQYPVSQPGP